MVRAQRLPDALERGEASWADVDRSVERLVATLLRFDDVLSAPARRATCWAHPSTARWPVRSPPGRSSCCATRPSTARPVLPVAASERVAVLGRLADDRQRRRRRVQRRVGPGLPHRPRRSPGRRRRRRPRRRHRSGPRRRGRGGGRRRRGRRGLHVPRRGRVHRRHPRRLREPLPATRRARGRRTVPGRWSRSSHRSRSRPAWSTGRPASASAATDRPCAYRTPTSLSCVPSPPPTRARSWSIQAGSAVVATEWSDAVPAVVQAWYGGSQAGPGLADVLLGDGQPVGPPALQRARRRVRPPGVRQGRARRSATTAGTAGGTSPAPGPRRRSPSGSACRTRPSPWPTWTATLVDGVVTVRATVRNTGDAGRRRRRAGLRRAPRPGGPASPRRLRPRRGAGGRLGRCRDRGPRRPRSPPETQRRTPGDQRRDATGSSSADTRVTPTRLASRSTSEAVFDPELLPR